MKVMVSGARGFLGSEICRLLRSDQYQLAPLARSAEPGFIDCDIANPSRLSSVLNEVRPDVIINCAAQVSFANGILAEQLAANTLAPGLMAVWAKKNNARMIQCSTILVHGARVTHVNAETPVATDTDYGRTKAMAEELIDASGCQATQIRFGGIFGARGPDHLGINRSIRSAISGQRPKIVGNGSARRNYIHVTDAARAIQFALDHGMPGVYRIAGVENLSIAEMLQQVCDRFLPGQRPECQQGADGKDQLVEVSPEFPLPRKFAVTLLDDR